MSDAIICDRCGNAQAKPDRLVSVARETTLRVKSNSNFCLFKIWNHDEELDLCDECFEELEQWMKREDA